MIVTRTPFRISFFGGGTDYPTWFREHGGVVLATTIDKYCYISCRRLPPFFPHKHRIVYSAIENVSFIEEIQHPAVRAVLSWTEVTEGLEIHHDGDLPARSGLGSSSSFTVGLLHALSALRGRYASKEELARNAIHIEQDILKENVGSQDQISAAYGGFNRIEFSRSGSFTVSPVLVPAERLTELQTHLLLFFTGFSRIASEVAASKISNMKNREKELCRMHDMVQEGIDILQDVNTPIDEFGELLHQHWQYKRSLSDAVSNSDIDAIYAEAMAGGADGGKLLGAGGGGFMLICARPERHQDIRSRLRRLIHVPFKFEDSGSKVVLYQPNGL
jgi:D-glycero-alpha-D-manno-heptose-7-phosphate kinase